MTLRILVLCTGNSARSIMAEMLLNHLGQGRIEAYSAGSHPAGRVNPLALAVLARHGIPASGARSKSWTEFTRPDAPPIDLVITVCDSAAQEVCPIWPGAPAQVHWGIADPAACEPPSEREAAFERAFAALQQRIIALLALPLETLSRAELVTAAQRIHAAHEH